MTGPTPLAPPAAVRSWLFVPGDRPERFARALDSGADAVILDLEDAVAPARREFARDSVLACLRGLAAASPSPRPAVWVRVPAPDAAPGDTLLHALAACPALDGWVLPKVEQAAHVQGWNRPVMAQIETTRALEQLGDILAGAGPELVALALGPEDLSAEIGAPPAGALLTPLAVRLVVAARAHGLQVYACPGSLAEFRDLGAWQATLAAGRALGSDGTLCIHPAQIGAAHAVFTPTDEERHWAHRVMVAWETEPSGRAIGGAVALDGRMVDRPVMLRAARILARAARHTLAHEART